MSTLPVAAAAAGIPGPPGYRGCAGWSCRRCARTTALVAAAALGAAIGGLLVATTGAAAVCVLFASTLARQRSKPGGPTPTSWNAGVSHDGCEAVLVPPVPQRFPHAAE